MPYSVNSQNQRIDCNPWPAGRVWLTKVMSVARERFWRHLTSSPPISLRDNFV